MIIVDQILQWARDNGYTAVYGSAEHVNEMLTSVPFANSNDGTVVIMHLIADSETVDGHDRATLAVYFASLCSFDFDGEALLPEQEMLKNIGKDLLNFIRTGNVLSYADPRWQYGYDDYAENVCWVCLRVTLTALAADCVPLPMPDPPAPAEDFAAPDGLVEAYSAGAGFQEWGKICEMAEWEKEEDWHGIEVSNVIFMFLARQRAEGLDLSVKVNGTYADELEYLDITDEAVQAIPLLAPYLGWVMVLGQISFEDVPISQGDTCNVSVTYQGEEVLGCSGEIPQII